MGASPSYRVDDGWQPGNTSLDYGNGLKFLVIEEPDKSLRFIPVQNEYLRIRLRDSCPGDSFPLI